MISQSLRDTPRNGRLNVKGVACSVLWTPPSGYLPRRYTRMAELAYRERRTSEAYDASMRPVSTAMKVSIDLPDRSDLDVDL